MEATRRSGIPVLAIPHNSNLSDGAMFATTDSDGRPFTAAYEDFRRRVDAMERRLPAARLALAEVVDLT